MFRVVPVVEERNVVRRVVVACRAPGVFEVSLQIAEKETDAITGEKAAPEKPWSEGQHCRPQGKDQRTFTNDGCPGFQPNSLSAMMRQMPLTPERLWNAEEKSQIERVETIPGVRSKERKMEEVMGNCVRVPPDSDRNN